MRICCPLITAERNSGEILFAVLTLNHASINKYINLISRVKTAVRGMQTKMRFVSMNFLCNDPVVVKDIGSDDDEEGSWTDMESEIDQESVVSKVCCSILIQEDHISFEITNDESGVLFSTPDITLDYLKSL